MITFFGALKLIMRLPGESAKQYRDVMTTILQKYFAGDPSLLAEVEGNAASNSVISLLARASLATGALHTASFVDDSLDRKRKRDLEDTQPHDLKVGVVTKFATTMDLINPNWRRGYPSPPETRGLAQERGAQQRCTCYHKWRRVPCQVRLREPDCSGNGAH